MVSIKDELRKEFLKKKLSDEQFEKSMVTSYN